MLQYELYRLRFLQCMRMGRPDMFMFKLFKSSANNSLFYLNNYKITKRFYIY